MYSINAYFLVGTALLLLIIGYAFKRYILLLFSGALMMSFGVGIMVSDLVSGVGEFLVYNATNLNYTVTNSTYLYQNTMGISQYVYGILFVLLGFFLCFDGVYKFLHFEEA